MSISLSFEKMDVVFHVEHLNICMKKVDNKKYPILIFES
ncbi:hypothetical protein C2W59_01144 [Bacillus pumilus]|uniref:Uncharacterized protein n=1 Tax=Bacillus pumilus TaxID=1408 RepID=A0AB34R251_BACPU|nr:hypothetical protein B4127_4081 [Bacillus pumilus]RAP09307.1 hypothetical protein C2W58_00596 [Bacillus pumilus]RAP19360.1 hypothetical protein C2W59_01144 [Bacillus pumilus]